MLDGILQGLATAVMPTNLMMVMIGCFVGTFIGMLPGLGPISAIALMIPITYGLEPASGLILMAGVYYGAIFGGSTSSILINAPGCSSTVVTAFDGYPMAQKGQAGKALALAAYASFTGGTLSAIMLLFAAPALAKVSLSFQSSDYFALMLVGGIRPHFYCLPILKRATHQHALVAAATSGSKKFFLGTDSAPHAKGRKEAACGCAGSYTAHAALELYAEVFEKEGKLENLEAFASFNGPDFYGLPRNQETVTLTKQAWPVAESMPFGSDIVVPIRAGENIEWTVK